MLRGMAYSTEEEKVHSCFITQYPRNFVKRIISIGREVETGLFLFSRLFFLKLNFEKDKKTQGN